MSGTVRRIGKVEFFNEKRQYGFVVCTNPDGSVVKFFLHHSQCKNALPRGGALVSFYVGAIPSGRQLALAHDCVVLPPEGFAGGVDMLAGNTSASEKASAKGGK